MSPKLRALIWEELRTGGVVAGWCVLVTALCLASARVTEGWELHWGFARPVALTLSLLPLVLLAFLLLYRTGNSGALTGGFSGRILLLPVETWKLAGLSLFVRAALLGAATLAVTLACRALFSGNGPAWILLLLLPGFFLGAQALDWLRRPNPLAAGFGLIALLVASAFLLAPGIAPRLRLDTAFLPAGAAFAWLVVLGGVSFAVSLAAAERTRRGARTHLSLRFVVPEAMPLPGWKVEHGFRSPRWALVWRFLRKDGFVLPLFAIALGAVAGPGSFVLMNYDLDGHTLVQVLLNWNMWLTVLDWGVWPVFALAALVWGGLRGGAGLQRGDRPSLTDYLYPVSTAEMAVTRLWGYGLALGTTWLVALLLSTLGFALMDNGLAWRIWYGSLAAGESSLRELLASRLMLPLVILIGAWVLTAIRTRLVAWILGLVVLYVTTIFLSHMVLRWREPDSPMILLLPFILTLGGTVGLMVWTKRSTRAPRWVAAAWGVPFALAIAVGGGTGLRRDIEMLIPWIPVAFIITGTLVAIVWSWRRGVMPARHALGCGMAWIATILLAYPFGQWQLSGIDRPSLLLATMFGALAVLPYPALLLDLHRRRHQDDTPIDSADHALRTGWGLPPALQRAAYALLVLAGLAAAWLCWPSDPAYIAALRAQGQPATNADLATLYGPLPTEENAAAHYLQVIKKKRSLYAQWYAWMQARRDEASEGDAAALDARDSPVANFAVGIEPNEMLWTKYWDVATVYHEVVSGPTSAMLVEVAAEKYPRSHYPIDLGSGPYVRLHHLSPVRDLARALSYEIWMAAMEDRPQDVLTYVRALGPVGESLREEPLLTSQLVRIGVHGILTSSVEQALNRTEFSDAQLAELQAYLSGVLPPFNEQSLFAHAMLGERVGATSILRSREALGYGANPLAVRLQQQFLTVSNVVTLRYFNAMLENRTSTATPLGAEFETSNNSVFVLAINRLPALDRSREAEWRCRVSLDMAATACAVERYRLKHGILPEGLDALVPAIMDAVPADPFRDDGGPVSYRVTDDGGYLLYSWAMNRTDENGVHQDRTEKKGSNWSNGDWIFSVAPLSFRNGPQFTEVPPEKEEEGPIPTTTEGRRGVR